VLPLDIEEHHTLDVNDHRTPLAIHKHMIVALLAVDQPILRTRLHLGRQPAKQIIEPVPGVGDPSVAASCFAEITHSPIQDDLLARAALRPAAVVDKGDRAETRTGMSMHDHVHLSQLSENRLGPLGVTSEQPFEVVAGHVFDHSHVGRLKLTPAISQVDLQDANPQRLEVTVGGLKQLDPPASVDLMCTVEVPGAASGPGRLICASGWPRPSI
jgi:hypothetical protein